MKKYSNGGLSLENKSLGLRPSQTQTRFSNEKAQILI